MKLIIVPRTRRRQTSPCTSQRRPPPRRSAARPCCVAPPPPKKRAKRKQEPDRDARFVLGGARRGGTKIMNTIEATICMEEAQEGVSARARSSGQDWGERGGGGGLYNSLYEHQATSLYPPVCACAGVGGQRHGSRARWAEGRGGAQEGGEQGYLRGLLQGGRRTRGGGQEGGREGGACTAAPPTPIHTLHTHSQPQREH